jgi:DNA-binding protein H-NS
MASVNVDKLSLKELLDLKGKLERAIAGAREREHGELKQDLAAFAEKRGFSLKELFGGRGKGKISVAKYDPGRAWAMGHFPPSLAAEAFPLLPAA